MKSLVLVFSLGLAGIDPLGLTILIGSLAAGAKKAHVLAFSLATFLCTILLGVAFSIFGEQLTDFIAPYIPHADDPRWAIVEIIVGLLILFWLLRQVFAKEDQAEKNRATRTAKISLFGVLVSGALFSLSAVPDPTFLAASAVASQSQSILHMIGLHAVWVLVSQCMLFVFAVAYLFDAHQPLTDFVQPIWQAIKGPVITLLRIALALVALLLLADALTLVVRGTYLIPL